MQVWSRTTNRTGREVMMKLLQTFAKRKKSTSGGSSQIWSYTQVTNNSPRSTWFWFRLLWRLCSLFSGEKRPSGWMLCAGQLSADHTCPRATTSPPIGPDGRRCVAWRESEEDNLLSEHKPLLWNIKCADSKRNPSYENHFTCSLTLTDWMRLFCWFKKQSNLFC